MANEDTLRDRNSNGRPTIAPAPTKPGGIPFGVHVATMGATLGPQLASGIFGAIDAPRNFPATPSINPNLMGGEVMSDPYLLGDGGTVSAPATSSPGLFSAAHPSRGRLPQALNAAEVAQRLQNVPLPFQARQALQQQEDAAAVEIDQIAEDIEKLQNQQSAHQEIFTTGTQMLEALGLPSTIESVREDPEIAAALDAVNAALASGSDFDVALDALGGLSNDEAQDVSRAFGREEYLMGMQESIRVQVHNLVQNRQDIERNLIDYEQWITKEAQAQELNLWDFSGDPSPLGRGYDTVVNDVEPWLDVNFNGIMSDAQSDVIVSALQNIWNQIPSGEEILDPETGEPTGEMTGVMTAQQEQELMQLATIGAPDAGVPGLGLTQQKAVQFVDKVRAALERGQQTAMDVDSWRTMERFEPGAAPLAAGIYEVAEELYDDPETAEQMAKSDFLHRIILMRSGGDVNFRGGGNQFGLGALPEHTYEQMGYNISELEGNAELQLEALLEYIGYWQYGAGYEGLEMAASDFVHNPDTWGDIG